MASPAAVLPTPRQLGHSKEEERLRFVASFAKAWWKLWRLGNGLWGSGNGLWLANRRPPSQGHCRPPYRTYYKFT